MSEWASDEEDSDGRDDDDGQYVFDEEGRRHRRTERDQSRMLRICCSFDNLMLSISDQVQKEKHDTAIARGAARELVHLFQFAVQQVANAAFGVSTQGSQDLDDLHGASTTFFAGKEAKYALEFLQEVTERFGKLDTFVRSTMLGEIDELQEKLETLQNEHDAAKQVNSQLQTDIADLRDFHSQGNMDSLMLHAPAVDIESDSRSTLQLSPISDRLERDGADNELETLKRQCEEYERLLEMAKQEIVLSHRERDVHKAHVAELSSELFKDTELGLLRNQLQSEKKRVKILETENVALLESQHDQALKIQSLLANSSPPTNSAAQRPSINRTASNMSAVANESMTCEAVAKSSEPELHRVVTIQEVESDPLSSDDTVQSNICDNFLTKQPNESASNTGEKLGSARWFSRLMASLMHSKSAAEQEASNAGATKLVKLVGQLPAAVLEQTAVRRRANVPTITPSSLGVRTPSPDKPRPQSSGKSRKPKSAASNNTDSQPVAVNKLALQSTCRCLIWLFFQRFLMAQEAQTLFAGQMLGAASATPSLDAGGWISLDFVVYHFFLERQTCDGDAMCDLVDFLRCLHLCRHDVFEVELFCQFLEGHRSHGELCFFLWALQAIDDTNVGISFDTPISEAPDVVNTKKSDDCHPTRYVCLLKATFVARTMFRRLKCKYSRPAPNSGAKRRPSTAPPRPVNPLLLKPVSPVSSPSKRKTSRTREAIVSATPDQFLSTVTTEESMVENAKAAWRTAVDRNGGRPMSLEAFNELLASFASTPTSIELAARLGPFYRPTGDERKLPWDVFVLLLLEAYRLQVQYQHEQLRVLFMHLHWKVETDERAAAARKAEELAQLAAATKKRTGSQKSQAAPATAVKKKKKTKRKQPGDSGDPSSRYLRGLTRHILAQLLISSGLVENEMHLDIDWLFIRILEIANCSAADIHFDAVYDALQTLRLIPDWSSRVNANEGDDHASTSDLGDFALTLRQQWHVLSSTSIAICENDPNTFVRKQSQLWLHRIDEQVARFDTIQSTSEGNATVAPWYILGWIRALQQSAWRLAAKRVGDAIQHHHDAGNKSAHMTIGTCLAEFYFADETVRVAMDPFTGFDDAQFTGVLAKTSRVGSKPEDHRSLERFYDTQSMHLDQFLSKADLHPRSGAKLHQDVATVLVQVEHVLQRYAVHFAYLFERFKTTDFNCSRRVEMHKWKQMAYELALIHPKYLPLSRVHDLFLRVHSHQDAINGNPAPALHELALDPTQFVELFVAVAFELYHHAMRRYQKNRLHLGSLSSEKPAVIDAIWKRLLLDSTERTSHHPAQVLALFCHEIVARSAHHHRTTVHEVVFAEKLRCPMVSRALLEHRAFLRSVFFYYAKQDEDAADTLDKEEQRQAETGPSSNATDGDRQGSLAAFAFQLEKTKRNSMSFHEFQMFLGEFHLLQDIPGTVDTQDRARCALPEPIISVAEARIVFESVMAIDNDDVSQLEFDEFAGAIVALAVYFSRNPFTLWHEKIHVFVKSLKSWMHEDDVRLKY